MLLFGGLVACFVLALSTVEAAKFPKNWKSCKHDSKINECMKSALQSVIPFMVPGVPSLGVNSIDPLHFDSIAIGKGNGPVSLDLDFKDFDVTGIKNVVINSVETDWKTMKIDASIPKVKLNGKYKVNGKVLILPVQGDGKCELELDNFKAHVGIRFSQKTTAGKVYYKIENMDLNFDCDLLKLRFENLFNGDKALGNQMNVFINENWRELFVELRPAIAKSFTLAFKDIGNRVFSKIPKDQITPS